MTRQAFPSHWSARYIGIDWLAHGRTYTGCDCWGLVRLVYMAELAIALPSLAGDYLDPLEVEEVRSVAEGQRGETWLEIPVSQAQPFDIILYGGAVAHVGVVAEPGRMLHVTRGRPSELARYESAPWRHRIAVVGRHRSLAR